MGVYGEPKNRANKKTQTRPVDERLYGSHKKKKKKKK
tara:strand:+ start:13794 stop:13904 length:111 start_codon:yes stop_codon:yes gene_type:complete